MEPETGPQSSDADRLAQEVVNAWGVNMQAGNAKLLSPRFRALVDKACAYRDAKRIADNRREFNMLTDEESANEEAARQKFLEMYRQMHPAKS
jgi:hypothetical protein